MIKTLETERFDRRLKQSQLDMVKTGGVFLGSGGGHVKPENSK